MKLLTRLVQDYRAWRFLRDRDFRKQVLEAKKNVKKIKKMQRVADWNELKNKTKTFINGWYVGHIPFSSVGDRGTKYINN